MLSKIFKSLVFVLLITAVQAFFFPGLFGACGNSTLLVALVFVNMLEGIGLTITYAILCSYLLSLYSIEPFGVFIVEIFLTVLLINWFQEKVFTNKSVYSLLSLTIIATVAFNLINSLYAAYSLQSGVANFQAWTDFAQVQFSVCLGQVLINCSLVVIVFIISHWSTKRFKAVFIDTTKT